MATGSTPPVTGPALRCCAGSAPTTTRSPPRRSSSCAPLRRHAAGERRPAGWDGPEEDILLLDRGFATMSFDSFYWAPSYGVWLRSYDQSRSYAELREWLQVLQWQDPERAGQKWVLKSPHHLTAADTVLDEF